MEKPKILVSIPNLGSVKTGLALQWLRWSFDSKFHVKIWPPEDLVPLDYARNVIRKHFLDNDFDFLFSVDSDIVPSSNILDLSLLDLDVVAPVNYVLKEEGVIPLVLIKKDKGWVVKGDLTYNNLEEVDATGLGCVMLSRRVLEQVPLFKFVYDSEGMLVCEEGFDWCERVKRSEFKIFVHTGYETSHFKTVDLRRFVKTQNEARILKKN